MPILGVLFTVILFYTSSRFRMPAVPFLMIGAGIAVDRFFCWTGEKRILRSCVLLLIFLVIYAISIHAPRPAPTGTEDFYVSKAYWSQGKYLEAKTLALKGRENFPNQTRFPVLLGMIALSQGEYEQAIQHNRSALEIDPNSADALHNLGLALLLSGRVEEARTSIERAIALSPEARYYFTLAKANDAAGSRSAAVTLYGEYLSRSKISDPFRLQAVERIRVLDGEKAGQ